MRDRAEDRVWLVNTVLQLCIVLIWISAGMSTRTLGILVACLFGILRKIAFDWLLPQCNSASSCLCLFFTSFINLLLNYSYLFVAHSTQPSGTDLRSHSGYSTRAELKALFIYLLLFVFIDRAAVNIGVQALSRIGTHIIFFYINWLVIKGKFIV